MIGARFESQLLRGVIEGQSYADKAIEWIKAKEVTFIDCDFSHAVIKNSYFHRAKFVRCKFIGTAFVDCNLRKSSFEQCSFEYCTFRSAPVPVREVLKNAPAWENTRRELAQSLRKNFDGLGDVDSARIAFNAEMEASCEHWRSALRGKTGYYIQHYRGFRRVEAAWKFFSLLISRYLWGYGESPFRLLFAILVMNALLAFGIATYPGCSESDVIRQYFSQLIVFLGLKLKDGCSPSNGFLSLEIFSRLVTMGLIGGVLFRRFARR